MTSWQAKQEPISIWRALRFMLIIMCITFKGIHPGSASSLVTLCLDLLIRWWNY